MKIHTVRNKAWFILLLMGLQWLAAALLLLLWTPPADQRLRFFFFLAFYVLLFTAPVFLIVKMIWKENPLEFLGLRANWRRGLLWGAAASAGVALIFFASRRFDTSQLSRPSCWTAAGPMLAGLFEEIPFRGFYQKVLKERWGFLWTNLFVSLLFALMHLEQLFAGAFLQLLMLFFIGLWLGYFYEKSRSLWAVILLHSTYNLMILLS